MKLSLFTHVHSSPLSLAARLYQCHAKRSHYINVWTFSGPCIYTYIHIFESKLGNIFLFPYLSLGLHHKEVLHDSHKVVCTKMFTGTLFVIGNKDQPKQ